MVDLDERELDSNEGYVFMEKIETIDFIDEIYKEMKKLDYAMSLFIAKIKYEIYL